MIIILIWYARSICTSDAREVTTFSKSFIEQIDERKNGKEKVRLFVNVELNSERV